MLIGRARIDGRPRWVTPVGEELTLIADPFTGEAAGDVGEVATGDVLAPVEPIVVIGLAQNGLTHPSPVQAWLKNPRTIGASGQAVTLRRDAGIQVAEAEIAIVIARDTTGLTAATAHEYVLGVTAVNDLSSPDRAEHDPRNFEGKAGAGFTPLGPWIDTEASIDTVGVSMLVDGQRTVSSSADRLPVSIRESLAYLTQWMPLGPGDVIMTGAPETAWEVRAGETVIVNVGDVQLVTPLR